MVYMEVFYSYAYIPNYIFLTTSKKVLILLFSIVLSSLIWKISFQVSWLFFFNTTVVSQLWQYKESKLFFVFIISHLLLNQLHAFK